MILYAASRKGQDLGLRPASSTMTLKYPKLDIADPDSIQRFAKSVEAEHASVDVLINNAGVNLDMQYSPVNVKTTLDTNYRGTLNVSTFSGRFYKLEMTTNEANRCAKPSFR